MKVKLEIKSWLNGSVLFEFESENNTIRETLLKAVASGADLRGANLRGADLRGANLGNANLRDADLRDANLGNANLGNANLRDADLRDADLRDANLGNANLRDANLRNANLGNADLRDANLGNANLRDADLRDADLRDANLEPIKQDFFMVLLHGIKEISLLKKNVVEGKIDGSSYEDPARECSCLSGSLMTAARLQNGPQQPTREQSIMSVRNASRPAEKFFLGINPGDTPENNQFSKIILDWINEFESLIA